MTCYFCLQNLQLNVLYCVCVCIHSLVQSFFIGVEAWAKLAQQWLVCAPLGTHLEPIKKQLMLLVII